MKVFQYKIMKKNISKYAMGFALTALLTTGIQATAGDGSTANPNLAVLSAGTPAELPAKASALISQADAKNREQTTIAVVKAAIALDPASAPAIVAAIAQSTPEMASIAAATAVGLVPNQAEVIARAAALAAPDKAGQIVQAVCSVLPAEYKSVAEAVAEAVPYENKEILAGVANAIPTLKASIDELLASYNGNVPSVSSVLNQAANPIPTLAPSQLPAPIFSAPGGPSYGGGSGGGSHGTGSHNSSGSGTTSGGSGGGNGGSNPYGSA